jgi:hypothetical protein
MSDNEADVQRLTQRLLGLAPDDPAVAALSATADRMLALVGADLQGTLFDIEPSHIAGALARGAAR